MGHPIAESIVELSADATWPAAQSEPLGPWRLRATHGYSHRANSVRTACAQAANENWNEMITAAEQFYRRNHLPSIFHISPTTVPVDLDAMLAGRGYATEKASNVCFAQPAEVRGAAARMMSGGEVIASESPTEAWLECDVHGEIGPQKVRAEICRRVPSPRVFVLIMENGQPIARAMSAINDGIAWLYCMATVPAYQRRGHGGRLIHFLADWALDHGAAAFYLQVLADNAAAQSVYSRAGFRRQYDYHYRVRR